MDAAHSWNAGPFLKEKTTVNRMLSLCGRLPTLAAEPVSTAGTTEPLRVAFVALGVVRAVDSSAAEGERQGAPGDEGVSVD